MKQGKRSKRNAKIVRETLKMIHFKPRLFKGRQCPVTVSVCSGVRMLTLLVQGNGGAPDRQKASCEPPAEGKPEERAMTRETIVCAAVPTGHFI